MKPVLLTTIRGITATLERFAPCLVQRWINRLFFSPATTHQEVPDIPNLEKRWLAYTKTSGVQSKCRVYTAGTGPVVLLVHGWEGSASSLSAIARQLLEKGLRVVLFDLPAHGFSPGRKTNLVEVGRIIRKIADDEGSLHALVGHSFGAACAGHAIKSGVTATYFVSISAPTTIDFIVDRFCSIVGASEKTRAGLIRKIEAIIQGPYEQASLTQLAAGFNQKGLIIHDRKDRMVPYSQAEALASAWPDARLIDTQSLGHSRILRDKTVIQAIAAQIVPAPGGELVME